jgi:hypothetical protein
MGATIRDRAGGRLAPRQPAACHYSARISVESQIPLKNQTAAQPKA